MRGAAARRGVAERAATWVVMGAVCCWSGLSAAVAPLLLRPVSTCAGPRFRCTGVVDLGTGLAAWGPAIVCLLMLVAYRRSAARSRATWPVALCAAVIVLALQLLGQALVPLGVVAR